IADEESATLLSVALRKLDRPIVGIVIARHGERSGGRVIDQPADRLRRCLDGELLPHVAAARSLLPLLTESGRDTGFVVIGSPGSEHPWAGYGYCSIAAAATSMLVRVLHEEARTLGVRVQLLAINRPVRTPQNDGCACEGWPDALAIGEQALALIDRIEARTADEAIVRFDPRRARRGQVPVRDNVQPADSRLAAASAQTAAPAGGTRTRARLEPTWNALEPIFHSIRIEVDDK
ncbi:MAG: hypothetical protein WBV39_00515, partial [Rudaea sp.]